MTRERIGELTFDKACWPSPESQLTKTLEIEATFEVQDILVEMDDELAVHVAETFINDPPRFWIDLQEAEVCAVEVFLWEVGGDVLCLRKSLPEAILEESRQPSHGREGTLGALNALKVAVEQAIANVERLPPEGSQ